jgi:hypothetical protein
MCKLVSSSVQDRGDEQFLASNEELNLKSRNKHIWLIP